jgi:hypothetical protein
MVGLQDVLVPRTPTPQIAPRDGNVLPFRYSAFHLLPGLTAETSVHFSSALYSRSVFVRWHLNALVSEQALACARSLDG